MSLEPQDIQGWFTAASYYEQVAKHLPLGATAVEVGSWLGRSTITFARYLKERGNRSIQFHVVDTWEGTPGDTVVMDLVTEHNAAGVPIYQQFLQNIGRYDVADWMILHRMLSIEAASLFADASLDFVYLDADHSYDAVCADINAWLPKIKARGTLAGDDWDSPGWPSVRKAVEDTLTLQDIYIPCEFTWAYTVG